MLFFLLCVAAALASKDTATKMVTEDLEPAAQSYYGGNNGGDFGGNGNGGYGHGMETIFILTNVFS